MAKKSLEKNVEQEEMLKNLANQIGQIQEYIKQLDNSLQDLSQLSQSLEDFGRLKKGERIFAPIANGIFVEADLVSSEKLLVNVGRGIVVKKSINETKELMKKQEDDINSAKKEAEEKIEEIYSLVQKG